MKVIVLGAGVIGITTAWYLACDGHEVQVIERQPAPGLETSFANGGQISVGHAEPWAHPGAWKQVLRWLIRADAPLLFRPRADRRQWAWILGFLRECSALRTERNITDLVNLGRYSRTQLQMLRADNGLRYDQQLRGILHFYTDPRELDRATGPARLMRELGLDREVVDRDQALRIEPALTAMGDRLVGATYTPDDESGDAHLFTRELAGLAAGKGVSFSYRHQVRRLQRQGRRVTGVVVQRERGTEELLSADAFVVCLGSYSPMLLAPLGLTIPVYPAKGYSMTVPVADPALAWQVSLTDDACKLVYSRLGDRLRIAGTAELSGWSTGLNTVRCRALLERVEQLFPGAGDTSDPLWWAGLRPTTPSNVPLIGGSRHPGLYLNTGHGTLGWTLACGSGRALADIIGGRPVEVPFPFTGTADPRLSLHDLGGAK